ncbi:MAG: Crp/Fnr family transcriptional regulator [Sphingobacteriales bacterium 50-39]|nr:Crp/Fnr family transcriptional regulator [Sphingobacteriales bacterium]OJW58967.1 MAG: Crp/Fnr family transcriptional regulator [Sphingobacteriales bacterium 50-39]
MSIKEIFPIDKWDFKSQSIFSNLPAEDYDLLTAHQIEQKYGKGEIIFREGAYPPGIFYIKHGRVKKYKVVDGSGEQIIYVANSGEFIGYHAIIAEERFPDSAAALEESVIVFIPKEDFLTILQKSPILNARVLKMLSHEFTVLVNNLALFSQRSVRQRFALQLIVLREKYKVNFQPNMPVEINLSREDLANLVGTGRENIVRILSDFKEKGLLQTRGRKIVVQDVKRLVEIANFR